jgi:hypothetical protein
MKQQTMPPIVKVMQLAFSNATLVEVDDAVWLAAAVEVLPAALVDGLADSLSVTEDCWFEGDEEEIAIEGEEDVWAEREEDTSSDDEESLPESVVVEDGNSNELVETCVSEVGVAEVVGAKDKDVDLDEVGTGEPGDESSPRANRLAAAGSKLPEICSLIQLYCWAQEHYV